MAGNWKWNAWFSSATLLLTWLLALARHNDFLTSVLRGVYSFILMFAIVYLFRWVLGRFAGYGGQADGETGVAEPQEEQVGNHIDLTTPEDSVFETEAHGEKRTFSPLNPKKLASKEKLSPEFLAGAIRNFSDDEG